MLRTLRFAGHDIARLRNDFPTLFFSIALPVFFYFVFGAAQDYAVEKMPGGNVGAFVMIGMALYAGVTGAVGAAGSIVTEHRSGWGRQLALTPLSDAQLLFANLVNIVVRAGLPVTAVFVAGALSGAQIDGIKWFYAFIFTIACAIPFGFYGIAWAQIVPSENSVSIATSSIVVLAFAGNLFVPLSGTMLDISRFTPLYGAQMLARWPVAEGFIASDGIPIQDYLWMPLVNIAVWTTLIIGASLLLRGRDKNRA